MTKLDATRKRELGLIHMAKAHFQTTAGLTDDDYRAVLQQVTGKISSADLDAAGRENLLKHFKAKGFVVKPKAGASRMPPKLDGQVTKLLAMWWSLAEAKAVTRPRELGYSDPRMRPAIRLESVLRMKRVPKPTK